MARLPSGETEMQPIRLAASLKVRTVHKLGSKRTQAVEREGLSLNGRAHTPLAASHPIFEAFPRTPPSPPDVVEPFHLCLVQPEVRGGGTVPLRHSGLGGVPARHGPHVQSPTSQRGALKSKRAGGLED